MYPLLDSFNEALLPVLHVASKFVNAEDLLLKSIFYFCAPNRQKMVFSFKTWIVHVHLQENLQKLIELQRDLVGIDTLVQTNRDFIREGCLQKLSKKGYQQRMFFLVSIQTQNNIMKDKWKHNIIARIHG